MRVGQDDSRQVLVNLRVPLGSILGSLLCNIYVNDIASLTIPLKSFQYTDDAAIVLASESCEKDVQIIQEDINMLNNWISTNDIFVKSDKTGMVCYRSPHKRIQCFLQIYLHSFQCSKIDRCDSQEVQFRPVSKYLGLHLDQYCFLESAHKICNRAITSYFRIFI